MKKIATILLLGMLLVSGLAQDDLTAGTTLVLSDGTTATVQSVISFDDGEWHTSCLYSRGSIASGQTYLYVDGVTVDSAGNQDVDGFNMSSLYFGADDGLGLEFTGVIDEFCLWVDDDMYNQRLTMAQDYNVSGCEGSQTIDGSVEIGDPVFFNVTKEPVDLCDIADWTDDAEITSSVNTSDFILGNALNLTKDT